MTNINTPKLMTFADMNALGYNPVVIKTPVPQAPVENIPIQKIPEESTLEKSPKKDTVVIAGKEVKKKTLAFTGIAAAALIAVGAACLLTRKKAPEDVLTMVKTTKELQEASNIAFMRANEMTETAKMKIDDVLTIFQNGGRNREGKMVAEIRARDDIRVMNEFAEDGMTTIRQTRWYKGRLADITEKAETEGLYNKILFEINEECGPNTMFTYTEGVCKNKKGLFESQREVGFMNGIMTSYSEGYKQLPDDGAKWRRYLCMSDGRPITYLEGFESHQFTDGSEKALYELRLDYETRAPRFCHEGYTMSPDGIEQWHKCVEYNTKTNSPARYTEGAKVNSSLGEESYTKIIEKDEKGRWVTKLSS